LSLVPGSAVGEAISVVGFDDAAGVSEHGEPLIERGGADATAGTQLGERQCGVGTSECASSMAMGVMDGAARCSTDSERSSPSRRR
jgi:hypothetical protein